MIGQSSDSGFGQRMGKVGLHMLSDLRYLHHYCRRSLEVVSKIGTLKRPLSGRISYFKRKMTFQSLSEV